MEAFQRAQFQCPALIVKFIASRGYKDDLLMEQSGRNWQAIFFHRNPLIIINKVKKVNQFTMCLVICRKSYLSNGFLSFQSFSYAAPQLAIALL